MTNADKNPYEDFSTEVLDHQAKDIREKMQFFQRELNKIFEVKNVRAAKEDALLLDNVEEGRLYYSKAYSWRFDAVLTLFFTTHKLTLANGFTTPRVKGFTIQLVRDDADFDHNSVVIEGTSIDASEWTRFSFKPLPLTKSGTLATNHLEGFLHIAKGFDSLLANDYEDYTDIQMLSLDKLK